MGRGSSKSGGTGGGGASGGVNPNNIKNEKDMLSIRDDSNKEQIDDVLKVAKSMTEQYGNDVAITGTFKTAEFKGKDANTIGCYTHDDGSIILNKKYIGNKNLDSAYDKDVESGFHPSRGNKSGIEAVAAHEYAHSLTANAQQNMGAKTYEEAATRIVTEARLNMNSGKKNKGTNASFRKNVSGYGARSDVEAIAEARADVYCNGKKAGKESQAIVNTLNSYLTTGKKTNITEDKLRRIKSN